MLDMSSGLSSCWITTQLPKPHGNRESPSTINTLILLMGQPFSTFVESGHVFMGKYSGNGLGGAGFALTLAQRYRGIVFALEHRFFGKSQPMGYSENSYSTSYFEKYLNVNQALDDLAYFIT